MPTPFTHLETAQRLLIDPALPDAVRTALHDDCPAFLLGSIAADARTSAAIRREATHFYLQDYLPKTAAWRTMLKLHPSMNPPHSAAHRAFVAGYAAHLRIDEIWSDQMLIRRFTEGNWLTLHRRFVMLHILLIYMDERDATRLEHWQPQTLLTAAPDRWAPFLPDSALCGWRDFVAGQILPGGVSQTLDVFGNRTGFPPEYLREMLDSAETMQNDLWAYITPQTLAKVEADMYASAREELLRYWDESH